VNVLDDRCDTCIGKNLLCHQCNGDGIINGVYLINGNYLISISK